MNLDIRTEVKITNYNPRTEGNGDELVMAGDLKVEMNVPLDVLEQIPVDKVGFKKLMYKDSGDLKGVCFDSIAFHREYNDVDVALVSEQWEDPIKLFNCTIKKINATFLPGFRATLRVTVQMHPDTEMSGELHEATTMRDLRIVTMPAGGQMDLEEQAEA